MVLYFSGTGNSRYLARRIAEGLEMPLYDLNACIKAGDTAPVQTGRDMVLVTPTYAWRIPRVDVRCLGQRADGGSGRFRSGTPRGALTLPGARTFRGDRACELQDALVRRCHGQVALEGPDWAEWRAESVCVLREYSYFPCLFIWLKLVGFYKTVWK